MDVMVEGCPCGTVHEVDEGVWARFLRTAGGLSPDVTVVTPDGRFLVPRRYIAIHGLKAAELPELAARYRFRKTQ
jgi:hypothetical protein